MFKKTYRRAGRLVPPTAKGLRARTVVLSAGEVMAWHSTQTREELLLILSGWVQLEVQHPLRKTTKRHTLLAGECAFLPSKTLHRVVNRAASRAMYVYVTRSRAG